MTEILHNYLSNQNLSPGHVIDTVLDFRDAPLSHRKIKAHFAEHGQRALTAHRSFSAVCLEYHETLFLVSMVRSLLNPAIRLCKNQNTEQRPHVYLERPRNALEMGLGDNFFQGVLSEIDQENGSAVALCGGTLKYSPDAPMTRLHQFDALYGNVRSGNLSAYFSDAALAKLPTSGGLGRFISKGVDAYTTSMMDKHKIKNDILDPESFEGIDFRNTVRVDTFNTTASSINIVSAGAAHGFGFVPKETRFKHSYISKMIGELAFNKMNVVVYIPNDDLLKDYLTQETVKQILDHKQSGNGMGLHICLLDAFEDKTFLYDGHDQSQFDAEMEMLHRHNNQSGNPPIEHFDEEKRTAEYWEAYKKLYSEALDKVLGL